MSNNPHDAGIPVLTEIIPAPSIAELADPAPVLVRTQPVDIDNAPAQAAPIATPRLDEDEWNRMEREIRERVLVQILERVDFVLEQRVRDSLADVLQTAVDELAANLKRGLHQSIKDAVSRAVTQEITKLQGSKK